MSPGIGNGRDLLDGDVEEGSAGGAGLDIGLVGPVARGASIFEKLLAPQKTYWPPKKVTGPYLKTKLAPRKNICVNLQFAHRPIIKLFIMLVYRLMILHTIRIDDTLI